MNDRKMIGPESSAVRVSLWRALHVLADPPPHVLEDQIGLQLVAPDESWRQRPDMHPEGTRLFRASIVARARFIEDVVVEQAGHGVSQYVILGAGLDTFAQRCSTIVADHKIFEIDQPGPQEWKKNRLKELGFGIPAWLRFVPVDFEAGDDWWGRLVECGFDHTRPAVIASAGVSMYLSRDAITAMLRQVATFAAGSTFIMSFLLPIELAEPQVRVALQRAVDGAKASGTPFLSFFTPGEMQSLAKDAGFQACQHVSAADLTQRYFKGRSDGLRLPMNSEELLVATT